MNWCNNRGQVKSPRLDFITVDGGMASMNRKKTLYFSLLPGGYGRRVCGRLHTPLISTTYVPYITGASSRHGAESGRPSPNGWRKRTHGAQNFYPQKLRRPCRWTWPWNFPRAWGAMCSMRCRTHPRRLHRPYGSRDCQPHNSLQFIGVECPNRIRKIKTPPPPRAAISMRSS